MSDNCTDVLIHIDENLDEQTNIVVAEMSGSKTALNDSGDLLLNLGIEPETKTLVVFGLSSSIEQKMPFIKNSRLKISRISADV